MKRVWIYSGLLLAGLVLSQVLPGALGEAFAALKLPLQVATMVCLSFIMIHVGYEFEVDKSNLRPYLVDYLVAATAAAFPWIFCTAYFVFVLHPEGAWGSWDTWKEMLLAGRFAAPTSAGVLFSLLAAAGLASTWVFRKARILAIFDDLDTVLFMIPLKMLIVGIAWQLGVVVVVMVLLVLAAWKWLHAVRWPVTWPWVLGYAAGITAVAEIVHHGSKLVDETLPIHLEVLLPAFVLGCVLRRPEGSDPHRDDPREGHQEGPEDPGEQRVASAVSAAFMVLVGLSMPALSSILAGTDAASLARLAGHVLMVTLVSNLGKMFCLFFYRAEASVRERLAVAVAMFPRGEVGAGILIVSLSYGIGGPPVAVAILSLALNLVLTPLFILGVKRLTPPAIIPPVPLAR